MNGIWLDLVLLALLAASLVLIYRLRPVASPLLGAEEAEKVSRWVRLGSRFRTVARQAGFEPDRLRWFFWLAKLGLAAALPLLLLELWPTVVARPAPLWPAAFALMGFLLPDLWLLLRRRQRRRQIQRALSFFLDLTVALLYAGLSVNEALRRAGREGLDRSHPLAREVRLLGLELDAGRGQSEVFQALAERTGLSELRALAAALGLAARHGASVEAALETQADLLRTKQREGVRARVTTAAVRAILPLFLCGFPVFLVLVLFPTILEMVETFRAIAESLR